MRFIADEGDELRRQELVAEAYVRQGLYQNAAEAVFSAQAVGYTSDRLSKVAAHALRILGHDVVADTYRQSESGAALVSRAWSALHRNRPEIAQGLANQALDLAPWNPQAEAILRAARLSLGHSEEAPALVKMWTEGRRGIAFNLVVHAFEKGVLTDLETVRAVVDDARRVLSPTADGYHWFVRFHNAAGEPEVSLAILEAVPDDLADHPTILRLRGKAWGA